MADQDARATLRVSLEQFDSFHLQKLRTTAYDRWTWDTGSDADRDWFEVADEILTERGIVIEMAATNSPLSINVGDSPSEMSINASKLTIQQPGVTFGNDLFEFNGSELTLGYELKRAIIAFLADELSHGVMMSNRGSTFSSEVINRVSCELDAQEWQIRAMFEKFMKEREASGEVAG